MAAEIRRGVHEEPVRDADGEGPNSTPLVVGTRLFTLGVTGILTAWNIADGTIAWRQDYSSSIDTSKLFCGTAMSPMLEGGSLIVQVGSDVHGGRVLALDPATGKERWTWKGPARLRVAAGRDHRRRAPDHHDDQRIDRRHRRRQRRIAVVDPFQDDWHENIVSPLWTGSALIVPGTRAGHARAIRDRAYARASERVADEAVWKNAEVTMYTVAPVLADGIIYGMSNKRRGQFVAVRATDGWLKWSTPGRDGNHASILQTASTCCS